MARKNDLPVIIGMKPPTKEIMLVKTEKPLKEYAAVIYHADWEEGVKVGEPTTKKSKRHGMACWLQFVDAKTMKKFGQSLIDFAERNKEG